MSWLVLVAIATIGDATRIFIDNYTSDVYFKGRGAVSQKFYYGYAWIVISLALLAITGFNLATTNIETALIFVASGIIGSLAGIPYYKALEIEDSTNLGIFIQIAPILYLVAGWLFLGDTFSPIQLVAFAIILAAPIIIVANARKRSRKVKMRAVLYALIYVLMTVTSNLIFIIQNSHGLPFIHEISLVFLGSGIASTAVVYAVPKWRRRFLSVYKSSKRKVLIPLVANTVISMTKSATYRLALITAPAVALASVASDATEPIVIFFMGIVLTLIWPKFGREKLNKKTVLVHLVATILVVIGIVLLQLPSM